MRIGQSNRCVFTDSRSSKLVLFSSFIHAQEFSELILYSQAHINVVLFSAYYYLFMRMAITLKIRAIRARKATTKIKTKNTNSMIFIFLFFFHTIDLLFAFIENFQPVYIFIFVFLVEINVITMGNLIS